MGILSKLNPFAAIGEGLVDIGKEFIEDKDKRNEFMLRSQELIQASADSARAHDKASYGNAFVDGVRGLIRPIITSLCTANYLYCKNTGAEFTDLDYAILGLVLGFWFGGRELQNFFKNRRNK